MLCSYTAKYTRLTKGYMGQLVVCQQAGLAPKY